jgi:hypothetical protein
MKEEGDVRNRFDEFALMCDLASLFNGSLLRAAQHRQQNNQLLCSIEGDLPFQLLGAGAGLQGDLLDMSTMTLDQLTQVAYHVGRRHSDYLKGFGE